MTALGAILQGTGGIPMVPVAAGDATTRPSRFAALLGSAATAVPDGGPRALGAISAVTPTPELLPFMLDQIVQPGEEEAAPCEGEAASGTESSSTPPSAAMPPLIGRSTASPQATAAVPRKAPGLADDPQQPSTALPGVQPEVAVLIFAVVALQPMPVQIAVQPPIDPPVPAPVPERRPTELGGLAGAGSRLTTPRPAAPRPVGPHQAPGGIGGLVPLAPASPAESPMPVPAGEGEIFSALRVAPPATLAVPQAPPAGTVEMTSRITAETPPPSPEASSVRDRADFMPIAKPAPAVRASAPMTARFAHLEPLTVASAAPSGFRPRPARLLPDASLIVGMPAAVLPSLPAAAPVRDVTAAVPAPVGHIEPAPAVHSDRLGQVHIAVEQIGEDVRVTLGLAAMAVPLVGADMPRLAAELAAQGHRLQTLDFTAGGGARHDRPPAPASASTIGPASGDLSHAAPAASAIADRYA